MREDISSGLFYFGVSVSTYALAVATELFFAHRQGARLYEKKNTLASVGTLLGHYFTSFFWTTFVVVPFFLLVSKLAWWEIGPRWGDPLRAYFSPGFLLLVLLDEFIYYWHHRAGHRFPLFWAVHQTHHTSATYNVLVAARLSWVDISTFVFWWPLVLLGFDPFVVIFVHAANILYNVPLHTKLIGKLPLLDRIFMTPSNHRVHHGLNPHYVNRNFGGVLIIWDKLFGTYEPEGESAAYGTLPAVPRETAWRVALHGPLNFWARRRRRGV